jgi:hypothetical protein
MWYESSIFRKLQAPCRLCTSNPTSHHPSAKPTMSPSPYLTSLTLYIVIMFSRFERESLRIPAFLDFFTVKLI